MLLEVSRLSLVICLRTIAAAQLLHFHSTLNLIPFCLRHDISELFISSSTQLFHILQNIIQDLPRLIIVAVTSIPHNVPPPLHKLLQVLLSLLQHFLGGQPIGEGATDLGQPLNNAAHERAILSLEVIPIDVIHKRTFLLIQFFSL